MPNPGDIARLSRRSEMSRPAQTSPAAESKSSSQLHPLANALSKIAIDRTVRSDALDTYIRQIKEYGQVAMFRPNSPLVASILSRAQIKKLVSSRTLSTPNYLREVLFEKMSDSEREGYSTRCTARTSTYPDHKHTLTILSLNIDCSVIGNERVRVGEILAEAAGAQEVRTHAQPTHQILLGHFDAEKFGSRQEELHSMLQEYLPPQPLELTFSELAFRGASR